MTKKTEIKYIETFDDEQAVRDVKKIINDPTKAFVGRSHEENLWKTHYRDIPKAKKKK